ncbi:alpha/beta fold hydrolase [Streptomyces sp. NPDC026589]|uniref:alpha/beta fold hydrolase n=1 Tax=Streptomyces sp. NPDC026589 TaxID=3155609 RepID=UPI0033F1E277
MRYGYFERFRALPAEDQEDFLRSLSAEPAALRQASLSYTQRRLWFLYKLDPRSAVYNAPVLLRFRGGVNIEALRRAVNGVCERHEVLRSRFVEWLGEVFVLTSVEEPPYELVELDEDGADAREASCMRLLADEVTRPFDLIGESPIRCLIVKVADDDFVLALNMHHIVVDGWSTGIIYRDLAALYRGFSRNERVSLPEPQLKYVDYAAWQSGLLRQEHVEREVTYWRNALEGAPTTLELPIDRPYPRRPNFCGDSVKSIVRSDVVRRLHDIGRSHGATPFLMFQALFAAMLIQQSGRDNVLVGIPESGRGTSDFSHVVGMFVNSVVLRADATGNPPFTEFLNRSRKTALDAYKHSVLPFDMVVEHLGVVRKNGRNPLFQAFFVHHPLSNSAELDGIPGEPIEIGTDTAKFDVELAVLDRPDGTAEAILTYATDLFDQTTAESMIWHFHRIAEAVAADPERAIGALPQAEGLRSPTAVGLPDPATDASRERPCVPPRNDTERRLVTIWHSLLGEREIGVYDDFFRLGGQSLQVVRLMAHVRKQFGVSVQISKLIEAPTVAALAELVDAGAAPSGAPVLVRLRRGATRTSAVVIHAIGGSVLMYSELSRALASDRPVYGLEAPGLDGGRAPLTTVPELASYFLDQLDAEGVTGAVVLIGWSMGGAIAYEMARQRSVRGLPVPPVVLLDTPLEPEEFSGNSAQVMAGYSRFLLESASVGSPLDDPEIMSRSLTAFDLTGMDEPQRLKTLLEWSRKQDLAGQELTAARLSDSVAVYSANMAALSVYRPGRLSSPGLYLAASAGDDEDLTLPWRERMGGSLTVQEVSGDHYTMLRPPNVSPMAEEIEIWLRSLGH